MDPASAALPASVAGARVASVAASRERTSAPEEAALQVAPRGAGDLQRLSLPACSRLFAARRPWMGAP